MKVAVVVGRRFFRQDGAWYTVGAAGSEAGAHYLDAFETVIVCGRAGQRPKGGTAAVTRLDPRIQVVLLPDVATRLAQLTGEWQLRAALRSVFADVDAVIVRLGLSSFAASALARQMGKPLACVIGARAYDSLTAYGTLAGRVYAPLAEWRARRAVRRCDYVSFVTQNYLQACYPIRPGTVTFAGSNVDIPTPQAAVLERRLARIATPRDTLVFGTVGNLAGRLKGIHLALEALSQQSDSLPPWRYRILGGGDSSWLRRRAETLGVSDRVHFDGTRPSGDPVLDWLDDIDVLLHPSLREGLPRAVIEAMSRGCPVIATSVAGTPELLPPDDLVPTNDIDALSAVLPVTPSPEWQADRARRNWTQAHRYDRERLRGLRLEFWQSFSNFAQTRSKPTRTPEV